MDRLLEEVRSRLLPLSPVRVVAFGSRARGDARPDSDLDLMVVLREGGSLGQRGALLGPPLRGLGVPLDLVIYTQEEYDRLRRLRTSVAAIADREGIVLHG